MRRESCPARLRGTRAVVRRQGPPVRGDRPCAGSAPWGPSPATARRWPSSWPPSPTRTTRAARTSTSCRSPTTPSRRSTSSTPTSASGTTPTSRPSHVYDAVHDRTAMGYLLAAFDAPPPGDLHFERLPGHDLDLTTHSTLFSGEQSNSSVAFGEDALLKLFRKITPGRNPDITVHEVLTRAGSDHVAALYGWLRDRRGGRRDPARDAPAVPPHRQRRLGARAGQRPQPVRRGRPARRRGRRRLRRRGGPARHRPARDPRLAGRALPPTYP